MTREGWSALVVTAVRNADTGDPGQLLLLSRLLAEQDLAKAALSRKGYGVTGTPWPDVVAEVHSAPYVNMLHDDLQDESP